MDILVLFLLFILIFLHIYSLRKVNRIDKDVWGLDGKLRSIALNEFRQKNLLRILESTLNLNKPLPPTRGWAASPDILCEVMYSALKAKPRNILECSSGVSTIVLAQCAKLNGCGHVISLEHDSQYAEMTRKQLIEFQLQEFATVIDAPLVDVAVDGDLYKWYSLAHLPESKFELLVIDGPPTVTFGQASTAHRKCHG